MKKIKLIGVTFGVAVLALGLGACSKQEEKGTIESGKVEETSVSLDDGEAADVDEVSLKDDGSFKEVVTGKEDPKIKFEATYKTDWSDDTWDDVDFKIDKVKVVEVDKFKDKDSDETYHGLMAMHYTLKNNGTEDVVIRPDEATIVLDDGKEIKGEHFRDTWEDIFEKDKEKDGHVHFKFDKIDEMDKIKTVKLGFKGHKKGSEDDKVEHTYDVELPLELEK
ncbi:hypothetical protein [Vagococcus sp.]|uniref:hypothetical protein n=1 Tax=Vagococcus sp. TaxID=1933889 RepID=UPI003F9B30BE